MRGGKARPKGGFQFYVKMVCARFLWWALGKKPNFETRIENHQDSWKSSDHASGSSTHSRKKGSWRKDNVLITRVCNFINCAGWYNSSVFRSVERNITFNCFVLNMLQGHHLQLRCHPLLFHNFLNSFTLRLLQLIILLSGRRHMIYQPRV